jgi:hypothetical protein
MMVSLCPFLLYITSISLHFFPIAYPSFHIPCVLETKTKNFGSNRNKPILNLFGCFSVCFAKPKNIFSVCFGVSDRYQNNRNKQNFVETNRKNLLKTFSIRGSSKPFIFFSRFESKQTETRSVSVVFRFAFSRKPKKFFRFVSMFQTGNRNNRNKLNLWYGEWKRLIF